MTSEREIGARFARDTIRRGELGAVVMIDLDRIFSAEFVEGFWKTVEAVGNAMKKGKK